jgi:serine/threonine protein kinase
MIGVGSVLAETYRVESELGRGGMSVVYAAAHLRLPTRVAIKVMQAHVTDATAKARFRREAEMLAALKHPNIVAAIDFNEADGFPFLVMEFLEGEDLATHLLRDRRLPLDEVLRIARQIGDGLTAAHERGIVHRDLKPQNVFLCRPTAGGREPVVKLLDFGISKLLGSTDALTRSALTMGTPSYMSPEQARGESGLVDSRADQFSLGLLLYEMLSGVHPFRRDAPLVTMSRILTEEPPPIPGVPDAVMRALSKALAKQPADRWGSVAELVRALDQSAGADELGRDATVAAPGTARRSRLPWIALALGLARRSHVTPPTTHATPPTPAPPGAQSPATPGGAVAPPVAPVPLARPPALPPPSAAAATTPKLPPGAAKEPIGKRHKPKPKLDPEFRLEDPFAPKP